MNDAISKALGNAAKRIVRTVSEDVAPAIRKMYTDVSDGVARVATRIREADEESAKKLRRLTDDLDERSTPSAPSPKQDENAARSKESERISKILNPESSANFREPNSLRGLKPEEVRNLIPENWVERPAKKGDGVRFLNPDRPGESIMIENGWPNATDPVHAGPYAKISIDGKVYRIPLEGNPSL